MNSQLSGSSFFPPPDAIPGAPAHRTTVFRGEGGETRGGVESFKEQLNINTLPDIQKSLHSPFWNHHQLVAGGGGGAIFVPHPVELIKWSAGFTEWKGWRH